MDARELDDMQATCLLAAISAANTAAATSGAGLWWDVSNFIGAVLVCQNIGACTGAGSVVGKLQAASDANGTGAVDLGVAFTSVIATGPNGQNRSFDQDIMPLGKTFLGYVGTITGFTAVLIGVTAHSRKRSN